MRLAIVNDLMLAVEALKRAILAYPGLEIAWIAYNGKEAVEKCKFDKPDLILMDLIMPVMDGVEATKIIMNETPCPILVVTATVTGNSSKVFDAMGFGALDAVCTPVFGHSGSVEGGKDLIKKIETISKLIGKDFKPPTQDNNNIPQHLTNAKLIAIGSSTGGPKALATILKKLPKRIGLSIVIIQHVDMQFASGLASWLDEQTKLQVKIIKEGMKPQEDTVYLAETNDHLSIDKDGTFYYTTEPISYPYRPSVNVFFKALAENYMKKGIAVILTGMGNDGAKGIKLLHEKGWYTIAQDKASSVVYGMPKAAIEENAISEIAHIDNIADIILKHINIPATIY